MSSIVDERVDYVKCSVNTLQFLSHIYLAEHRVDEEVELLCSSSCRILLITIYRGFTDAMFVVVRLH